MERFFGFVIIFGLLGLLGYGAIRYARSYTREQLAQPVQQTIITPSVIPTVKTEKAVTTSVFIPYWSIPKGTADVNKYDEFIYFGVTPTENGIDTSDSGYKNLSAFRSLSGPQKKILTLRMLDSTLNFKILANKTDEKNISVAFVNLAKQNGFDGVLLDLEVSAIPFDSLIKQITDFSNILSQQAKQSHLSYAVSIYGDTFYRLRPFDVKAIASSADQIYIMAYDFTKANGNPGPTFPLKGKETYGYDTEAMLSDFLTAVPKEKLTVTFGMFGYDWTVDDKGKATDIGKPVTMTEAETKYITNCSEKVCSWKRDTQSFGIQVAYTAHDDTNHIVWIDDSDSAKTKEDFLRQRGISHFSYWAYSYF